MIGRPARGLDATKRAVEANHSNVEEKAHNRGRLELVLTLAREVLAEFRTAGSYWIRFANSFTGVELTGWT